MNFDDKKALCDILTRCILSSNATIYGEENHPSPDVDRSDDILRSERDLVTKLRKIREEIEGL